MRRLLEPCWWILFLKITSSVLHYVVCFPALTEGYVGALHENRHGSSAQIRRRKASGDPYWAYSGELMGSKPGLHRPVAILLSSPERTLNLFHIELICSDLFVVH
uniref:Uncharacterized protein n=1 Tax=Canis lupus dingo TaxID=286419 RepID=A0A8C0K8D8_CANLU